MKDKNIPSRLAELEQATEDADLWDNPSAAQKLLKEQGALRSQYDSFNAYKQLLLDTDELYEMSVAESDESMLADCQTTLEELEQNTSKALMLTLLNGTYDKCECFIEIHAGAGGTESMDWARMLCRMYSKWATAHDMSATMIDSATEQDGLIKSATLRCDGLDAFGWLKAESGVHRLVRHSPFDSQARRHTSFVSVSVTPVIDDDDDTVLRIPDSDIRIDTYRSSGAGGQHVNTTDSAVRITHFPTGIVVQCQNERSQIQNRKAAMSVLKSRILEQKAKARAEAKSKFSDSLGENAWGNQIRSYVLQPYQMVKDHRTDVETSDADSVLEGNLDAFLEAALLQQVAPDSWLEDLTINTNNTTNTNNTESDII
jgi:peptide chain release factor 2